MTRSWLHRLIQYAVSVFNHFNGFKLYLMATAVAVTAGGWGMLLTYCAHRPSLQPLHSSTPYQQFADVFSFHFSWNSFWAHHDNVIRQTMQCPVCVHVWANCTAHEHVMMLYVGLYTLKSEHSGSVLLIASPNFD